MGHLSHLGTKAAPLRASLAASQILGFTLVRHVLNIQPLASMSKNAFARHVGPTLQRYVIDDAENALSR